MKEGETTLLNEEHRRELEVDGVTVIPGVVSEADCDLYVSQYKKWLEQFGDDDWPNNMHSIIQHYRIGHFEPTWNVRLKAKRAFAELWMTDKLLTSIDGVAIGEPPEVTNVGFAGEGKGWLHVDQSADRQGLHAYQGGVYLETASETDWCFRAMKGSHLFHEEFFENNEVAAERSNISDYYRYREDDLKWIKSKDCTVSKIPVPKGGLVLWDSRVLHDNARPEKGRSNSDRWRHVVFVSMTPAIWARPEDMYTKKTAYEEILMTTHWSSQGVGLFSDFMPELPWLKIETIEKLPEVAKKEAVLRMCGVQDYDFKDGTSNGPSWKPKWKR